jgi:hypothetical protein
MQLGIGFGGIRGQDAEDDDRGENVISPRGIA